MKKYFVVADVHGFYDEMIKALNLEYNKKRQSMITNELIEVISGAEAV